MGFTYNRTIYLSDTDGAGVVYFATLLHFGHEAYENALVGAGINFQELVYRSPLVFPISHCEGHFFRPLFCGDRVIIHLTIPRLEETEFEINYEIFRDEPGNVLCARGSMRHVCIDRTTRERSTVPNYIVTGLQKYQNFAENYNIALESEL